MAESGRGGVKAFTWSMDGIGYSLVGTLPADLLHPLADEVRAQVRS
jgi:anti-sigma factor RsiW